MDKDMLNILWTNADPLTSELMVLMYANASASRGWWKKVRVIIWGATAKLVAEDPHIQHLVQEARKNGVEFSACEACADRLGVKDSLKAQQIDIRFWGQPLTELIKNQEHLIAI
ncbi:MAG: DsrE family protein [Halodesulfovibrio sp.]